jgi:hypothetical protein
MPRTVTEEVQRALDEVREAARAVLALPARTADLVNALHRLVMRAGRAAATVLMTLPRDQLAKVKVKKKSRARARKRRRRSRRPGK